MVQNSSFMILLVVEDEVQGSSLADLITTFGYNVNFVTSHDAAIAFLKKERVDLVVSQFPIIDLVLHGVLHVVHGKNKNTGIIVIGQKESYLETLESGALDHISLPLEELELELKLQRAITECDLRNQLALLGGVDKDSGLLDEKAFLTIYGREIERTLRQDGNMHVVMISVALEREEDLQQVVTIIRDSIREGVDQAFCLDSKEFALTLPETNADQAAEIIQRMLLRSLEQGLGASALAIGCALCCREPGKTYPEVESDCLAKVRGAVQESRRDGGHAAVYRR